MRKAGVLVVALVSLLGQPASAAERTLNVEAQTRIIDGRREWQEARQYPLAFRVEVVADRGGVKEETARDGRPFITASPGEEYLVRVYNPLPVRVAANLSIDGLNSLTGRPATPEGGRKWVIEPESWVDIRGWQVSAGTARRFYFTSKQESYATWRSNDWGRDLAVNCGVIGVAYFWSQRELDEYFQQNPVVLRRRDEERRDRGDQPGGRTMGAPSAQAEKAQRAGTGMGVRRSNPVTEVRFDYDRGMYRSQDAVVITYDFPEERRRRPEPFAGSGYAPEQRPGRHRDDRREAVYVVFDNNNIARVFNGPRRPTRFTVDEPTRIVKIVNYHWNNGRGARPGTIGLERRDGRRWGPWEASGSAGQGGVRDAFWTAYPEVTLPAGTYRVIDSQPGTWSYNAESGDSGFSRVEGE